MQFILNIYKFSKEFKYYIDFSKRVMYIKNLSEIYILKLPSIYFLNIYNYIKILFTNFYFFKSFINFIKNSYKKFFSFYFFKLKLKGLGYRIRLLSRFLVKIFYNRSNYYYMHIPSNIIFKYRTRNLFFLSSNYITLKLSMLNLLLLKKYLVYRLNGLIYIRQIILMKPGKNKFR